MQPCVMAAHRSRRPSPANDTASNQNEHQLDIGHQNEHEHENGNEVENGNENQNENQNGF